MEQRRGARRAPWASSEAWHDRTTFVLSGGMRERRGTRPATVAWGLTLGAALGLASLPALAHEEVVPPRALSSPLAAWPGGRPSARDAVVPLTVVVGVDGAVSEALLDASVSPDLDRAAQAHALAMRFEPATKSGVALKARIRLYVRFVGSGEADAPPAAAPSELGPKGEAQKVGAPKVGAPNIGAQKVGAPTIAPRPLEVTAEGASAVRSASESRLDRRVLAAAPHRTASEALRSVPGVFVTQHSGEGKAHQIFLRGFDAQHGQDLEVWVGGAPVNDVSNVHGQGYADLHFVMPEIVDELSTSFGPFEPRQGDFAVAGTVRMKLGLDEPGFVLRASGGSYGARRLFLGYRPPSEPSSTFAAFEGYQTDGFGPSRSVDRGSLVAQLERTLGPVTVRALGTAYATRYASAGVLLRSDVERGRLSRVATYDPDQGGSSSRFSLVLDLRSAGDPSVEKSSFSLAPYVVHRSLRLLQNFTGALLDPVDGDRTEQTNDAFTFGLTSSYRRVLGWPSPRDALEVGLQGRGDLVEQRHRRLARVGDRGTQSLVDASVTAAQVAAYLDLSLSPTRWLTLRGGGRVDVLAFGTRDRRDGEEQSRSSMGPHFSARGTVDTRLARGLHVMFSAGNGFRSPQARSLGDGERAPFTEVVSLELGARYEGELLTASLAGFHTQLSDDLVFDPATGRNERLPSTARTGVVGSFRASPTPWLLATASLTFTRAELTASSDTLSAGDLVPYAPQVVARTELAATPTLTRLRGHALVGRLGMGASLLHGRPLPFGEQGRDAFLLDGRASLRYRWVELGLDAQNLLDATWYDSELVFPSNFSAYGAGGEATLVPRRHVTVGPPLTLLGVLTLSLS